MDARLTQDIWHWVQNAVYSRIAWSKKDYWHPQMKKIQIDNVLIALRRVIRATDIHSHNLARKSGLTTPQLLWLQAIKKQGEVTIGTLAEDVSLSQATVTSILDRLVAKELIVRKRSELDKRKVHAYLTDQGKKTLKKPLQHCRTTSLNNLSNCLNGNSTW